MKARLVMLFSTLALAGGCRASRLGQDPVIRAAFAAQAQEKTDAPAKLDATDALLIMARHREPMSPPEAASAARAPMVLTSPELGGKGP